MKRAQILLIFCAAALAAHAQSSSWTGFHVGATLGRSAYTSSWTDVDGYRNGGTLDSSLQKSQTGGNLGYDYQIGNTVFGLEYDRTLSAIETSSAYDRGATLRTDNLDRLSTLRLRAGLAYGSTLVYLSGGLGQAKASHAWIASGTGAQSWPSFRNDQRGLVAGAGLEQKLGNGFALRVEYLHFHSGEARSTNASGYAMQVTDDLNTLRVGFSYFF